MHQRAGDRHIVRADSVDEDELEFASDQIERVFNALAAIARDGDAVLDGRLRLVEETRFDQELDRTGAVTSTLLVLDEGTCPDWELDRRDGGRPRRARRSDDARPGGRPRRPARGAVEERGRASCAATCAISRATCSRSARWSSHDDLRSLRRASGRGVVRDAVPAVRRRAQLLRPDRDRALLRGQRAAAGAGVRSPATAACSSSTAAARSRARCSATTSPSSPSSNGWAGIVVNGCVRDVVALAELPIGIKALGTNPRPSGKAGAGEVGVPVTFGGAEFAPGAMLHADDDGVIVLAP